MQQDLGVRVAWKSHQFFAILALSLMMNSPGPQKIDYDKSFAMEKDKNITKKVKPFLIKMFICFFSLTP